MSQQSSIDLEIALAEVIHRARNDLAAVAAMLRLQANETTDPAACAALLEAEMRVRALSSLNRQLDIQVAGVAAVVDCVAFLDGLAADLRTMHLGQRCVTIEIRAEPHRLRFNHARQLGLIVNELVVNALKYAFPEGRGGTVSIAFECRSDTCTLTVKDDGIGVDPAAPPQGTGLGRRVVRALAAKLGGSFQIGPGADGGTECAVRWPSAPTRVPDHCA
jgi:two-component sensor histidine kinase